MSAETSGLFINLATSETWRSSKAIRIAQSALDRGYSVTVFLNVDAVRLADTTMMQQLSMISDKTVQDMIRDIIADGATVIIGVDCMRKGGVKEENIIDGLVLGTPDILFEHMLADGVKVISW